MKHFWVPVEIHSKGYVRVEAPDEAAALERVESGDITDADLINQEIEMITTNGAPMVQEVS